MLRSMPSMREADFRGLGVSLKAASPGLRWRGRLHNPWIGMTEGRIFVEVKGSDGVPFWTRVLRLYIENPVCPTGPLPEAKAVDLAVARALELEAAAKKTPAPTPTEASMQPSPRWDEDVFEV